MQAPSVISCTRFIIPMLGLYFDELPGHFADAGSASCGRGSVDR
jgi:hypothetical protein